MEESIKNRIILILSILAIIFFIGTISSCSNAYRQRSARDKEMATRLDLEEKLNKVSQEKGVLEQKLRVKDKELEGEKTAHETLQKALTQEQLITQSLKEDLQKITKLNEVLDERLKEVQATVKSGNAKK